MNFDEFRADFVPCEFGGGSNLSLWLFRQLHVYVIEKYDWWKIIWSAQNYPHQVVNARNKRSRRCCQVAAAIAEDYYTYSVYLVCSRPHPEIPLCRHSSSQIRLGYRTKSISSNINWLSGGGISSTISSGAMRNMVRKRKSKQTTKHNIVQHCLKVTQRQIVQVFKRKFASSTNVVFWAVPLV